MMRADLDGALLAAVSRSFYLTIRLLPQRLRAPIGLAYLLARASDTIADTATVPGEVRLDRLARFAAMVRHGTSDGLAGLQDDIHPAHPGERQLLARLDECLERLRAMPAHDKAEIISVLDRIIAGQTLDLRRFGSYPDGVAALPTATELEEYTYLVAGCVGEFWTHLCLHHFSRYARLDAAELCSLARNYGKGLQLINILRDLPSDLHDGRCYLPEDELRAAGSAPALLLARPESARSVFEKWTGRAAAYLEDGRNYVRSLQPPRVRAGCFLPWYLGNETLRLMKTKSPLQSTVKVKVPRSTVRTGLILAGLAAFSNAPLRTRS